MNISEILNVLLGGGLVATILALATLRSKVRKAEAEAKMAEAEARKADADAETVRMDNAEHATRILLENIVKPLREELDETRRYLDAVKREMARLRKSLDRANTCRYHDDCPVLDSLRDTAKGEHGNGGDKPQGRGHAADADAAAVVRGGADGAGKAGADA